MKESLKAEINNEPKPTFLFSYSNWRADFGTLELELADESATKPGSDIILSILLISTAVKESNLERIKHLIEKEGADVNAQDKDGRTVLMYIAEYGYLEIVKYLLDCGANVNAKDEYGVTALMLAARNGRLDTLKCLMEHGAEVNAKSNNGRTPLMYAVEYGCLDIVKYLVENAADVNATNSYGQTVLMVAASQHHLEIMKYLVEKGALDAKGKSITFMSQQFHEAFSKIL